MKTQILNMYPDFTNEEVQSVIEDYNTTKETVCSSCREHLTELESEVIRESDYYNPAEYEVYCPLCGEKEVYLDTPTFEEFLHITA